MSSDETRLADESKEKMFEAATEFLERIDDFRGGRRGGRRGRKGKRCATVGDAYFSMAQTYVDYVDVFAKLHQSYVDCYVDQICAPTRRRGSSCGRDEVEVCLEGTAGTGTFKVVNDGHESAVLTFRRSHVQGPGGVVEGVELDVSPSRKKLRSGKGKRITVTVTDENGVLESGKDYSATIEVLLDDCVEYEVDVTICRKSAGGGAAGDGSITDLASALVAAEAAAAAATKAAEDAATAAEGVTKLLEELAAHTDGNGDDTNNG